MDIGKKVTTNISFKEIEEAEVVISEAGDEGSTNAAVVVVEVSGEKGARAGVGEETGVVSAVYVVASVVLGGGGSVDRRGGSGKGGRG